ncbi:arylsulfatase [Rubritalea spongiae]|uniref:Arylsulfatase n=1 Tax=Rubritalea spongiae TaxID=430797 RepID=A0ABW5E2K0_9BACT
MIKKHLIFALSLCLPAFAAEKPNIIYIIADDLGYADISCYGQKRIDTPNIDKLAAEGIRFTTHYSGSTVCAPSRCSLMTGKDQGHATIRGNGEYELTEKDYTIAHALKKAGYRNGMVGKSCVTGNTQNTQTPFTAGFDYFYGVLSHKDAHRQYPFFVYENHEKITLEGNKGQEGGNQYSTDIYTKKAIDFIEREKKNPFFLLLSFSVPHADIIVPEDTLAPLLKKFPNGKKVKARAKGYSGSPNIQASYAGMIQRMDQNIGKLVAKLDKLGLSENTIISFTSDNGPSVEGGYHANMFDSNGIYRGTKRDMYEGGIRVPYVVKWPAKIKAGSTSDHLCAFWDVLPTLSEIVGVEAPNDIQGISFLPTLTGEGEQKQHKSLYWEFHERGGRIALRQGDWKIVKYDAKSNKGRWELYNLKDDPSETNNLAKQHPEMLDKMAKLAKQSRTKNSVEKWNF